MLLCLLVLLHPDAAQRLSIQPNNEVATRRDWLLQGQVSILEDSATRPFRWLVATPKDPIATLNRTLDISLLRACVELAQWLGVPVWQRTTFILQHDAATTVTVRGQTGMLEMAVGPLVRRYSFVQPAGFHTLQDHIEPLTTTRYDGYGFSGSTILTSPDDARPRIARWYGTDLQTYLTADIRRVLSGLLILPLFGVWLWSLRLAWWVEVTVSVLCLTPWGVQYVTAAPVTVEPFVTLLVAVLSWLVVERVCGPLPAVVARLGDCYRVGVDRDARVCNELLDARGRFGSYSNCRCICDLPRPDAHGHAYPVAEYRIPVGAHWSARSICNRLSDGAVSRRGGGGTGLCLARVLDHPARDYRRCAHPRRECCGDWLCVPIL